jgi:hypothetical protein
MAFRQNNNSISFTVTNNLELARKSETISIPAGKVTTLIKQFGTGNLLVREKDKTQYLLTQAIDTDADGNIDAILFQTDIGAKEKKNFIIEGKQDGARLQPETNISTYSRFVPERANDYAWENDRIGFRMYGLQSANAPYKPGAGIDGWLKRVEYPIINKWYKNNAEKEGAYHIDTGEGHDPYQVGAGRGIGGIGIWLKDSLYVSADFVSSKTIAVGPIRTIFELTYAPWDANGNKINEVKRISLDLGSNLSRFEEMLSSDQKLPNMTVGISLHDKKGEVKASPKEGWFRYWEPMDDSFLGTGIVLEPSMISDYKDYRTTARDQSHLLVITKSPGKNAVYYAGFAWKKSGQFNTPEEWDLYLKNFGRRLASPLDVKF